MVGKVIFTLREIDYWTVCNIIFCLHGLEAQTLYHRHISSRLVAVLINDPNSLVHTLPVPRDARKYARSHMLRNITKNIIIMFSQHLDLQYERLLTMTMIDAT